MDCLSGRLGKCSNPASLQSTQSTNEGVSLVAAPNSFQSSDPSTINAGDDDLSLPLSDPTLDSLNLPDYDPAEGLNFVWGSWKGVHVCQKISDYYDEMVTWKRNIFKVSSGKHEQAFVNELMRLFNTFAEATSMECIALTAAMVLLSLILQKTSRPSKTEDDVHCIERRMKLWLDGELGELLGEVRTIQSRLPPMRRYARQTTSTAQSFSELMMEGKVWAATRLCNKGGEAKAGEPLSLDEVIETLHGMCTIKRSVAAETSTCSAM